MNDNAPTEGNEVDYEIEVQRADGRMHKVQSNGLVGLCAQCGAVFEAFNHFGWIDEIGEGVCPSSHIGRPIVIGHAGDWGDLGLSPLPESICDFNCPGREQIIYYNRQFHLLDWGQQDAWIHLWHADFDGTAEGEVPFRQLHFGSGGLSNVGLDEIAKDPPGDPGSDALDSVEMILRVNEELSFKSRALSSVFIPRGRVGTLWRICEAEYTVRLSDGAMSLDHLWVEEDFHPESTRE